MVRFEDLPVQSGDGHTLRRILEGKTHSGYGVEMHETDLAPGAMPHPAHHHAHEEVFLVREGTLEVTITGQASRLGPGSVAYVASNAEHGIRNSGPTHTQYFVIALGTE
jgi:quercetin dioxygenase-like cupin family protein